MEHPDLIRQAHDLVEQFLPDARAAVLGGSAAAGRATVTSDLDVAVLLPPGEPSRRETIRFRGRLVELFLHTREALDEVFAADRASRRGTMQTIYAHGVDLHDRDGCLPALHAEARNQLDARPPALASSQVEDRRYSLTNDLDDLADVTDRHEQLAVAEGVLRTAADLLCDHSRAWCGGGKWLPRRLLAADGDLGARLLAGHLQVAQTGEVGGLTAAAAEVLALAGGPLREGYARPWRGGTVKGAQAGEG